MTTKQKPEHAFSSALAAAYPRMSGEQRRGIVGLAIRAFVTPGEISRPATTTPDKQRLPALSPCRNMSQRKGNDMKILHDSDTTVWQPASSNMGATIRTIIEIGGTEVEVMSRVHPEGRLSLTVTDVLAEEEDK